MTHWLNLMLRRSRQLTSDKPPTFNERRNAERYAEYIARRNGVKPNLIQLEKL